MAQPEYWISSARQGGFSSLSLPTPGYCGRGIVIYSDGSSARSDDPGVSVSAAETTSPYAPTFNSSGGPFGESYAGWQTSIAATGIPLTIGTGDFTLEGWFRYKPEYGAFVSTWPMLGTGTEGGSGPVGFALYTSSSFIFSGTLYPATVNFWVNGSRVGSDLNLAPSEEGEWMHLAVARSGGTLSAWCNGRTVYSASNSVNYASARISSAGNDIGQIQYTPSFARYSGSTITVPTAPFR